jgi:hypothetical protein
MADTITSRRGLARLSILATPRHFPDTSAFELPIAALPCAITGPRLAAIGTFGLYGALAALGPAEEWPDSASRISLM